MVRTHCLVILRLQVVIWKEKVVFCSSLDHVHEKLDDLGKKTEGSESKRYGERFF